ncbi:MAG: ABC transporter substrate-binding protein [Vallitalea sp.]|nr:ABC transporter substrate-binding protein [Vallitalea sp.]
MKKLWRLLISTMLITMIIFNLGGCGKNTPTKDTYESDKQVESQSTDKESKDSDKVEEKDNDDKDNNKQETVWIEKTTYPLTITDQYGEEVIIEEEPQTIISISPELTEIIFHLESGDKLIGRTDFCDYPIEVENIESIGKLTEPNIEKIVDLNPDIVFTSAHVPEEAIKQLKNQGINVVALSAEKSFEGTYSYINTIGQVLNKNGKAYVTVKDMKDEVATLTKAVEGKEKPTVYFVVGFGDWGHSTATGETFLSDIIEMAGGENVAKDGTAWSYTMEQIVDKDPQIVICSNKYDMKKNILAADGYKDLTAVKEGRLYETDENIFYRQTPRLVEGLKNLIKIIHPEVEIN